MIHNNNAAWSGNEYNLWLGWYTSQWSVRSENEYNPWMGDTPADELSGMEISTISEWDYTPAWEWVQSLNGYDTPVTASRPAITRRCPSVGLSSLNYDMSQMHFWSKMVILRPAQTASYVHVCQQTVNLWITLVQTFCVCWEELFSIWLYVQWIMSNIQTRPFVNLIGLVYSHDTERKDFILCTVCKLCP